MEQILALPSLPHPSPKDFAVCSPAAQGMFICMDCGEQGLPEAGNTITGGQAAGSRGGMLCDPTIGNAAGKQVRRQLEGEATVGGSRCYPNKPHRSGFRALQGDWKECEQDVAKTPSHKCWDTKPAPFPISFHQVIASSNYTITVSKGNYRTEAYNHAATAITQGGKLRSETQPGR